MSTVTIRFTLDPTILRHPLIHDFLFRKRFPLTERKAARTELPRATKLIPSGLEKFLCIPCRQDPGSKVHVLDLIGKVSLGICCQAQGGLFGHVLPKVEVVIS